MRILQCSDISGKAVIKITALRKTGESYNNSGVILEFLVIS